MPHPALRTRAYGSVVFPPRHPPGREPSPLLDALALIEACRHSVYHGVETCVEKGGGSTPFANIAPILRK